MENADAQEPAANVIRVLAATLALSVMSGTMFNIALPAIRAEFGLSFAQASWIASVYLLIFAVGTVVYGKLSDFCRLKNLLAFGLCAFALGSAIGLCAPNFGTVLLGRAVQAAGSAVIPAAAGIIPVRYFPPERRGRALGIAMTGGAIGSAAGPAVAAVVIGYWHWRFLFAAPLLSLTLLPYYRRYLNDKPPGGGRIDWIGGGLLAGAVVLLLLSITNGSWPAAAGCLALFIGFAIRIGTAAEPFIRPEQLRNKGYAAGLALAFATTGVGYALPFVSPLLLAQVHRLSPGSVGLVLFPAAAATALVGRLGGKIADLRGHSFLFYLASLLYIACFGLLALEAGSAPAFVAVCLIGGNIGQAFLYIALSKAVSGTLAGEQAGVGMGLLSMLNFIAGAVSASLYGKAIDRGAARGWGPVRSVPQAYVYGNLYLLLVLFVAAIALVYYGLQRRNVW